MTDGGSTGAVKDAVRRYPQESGYHASLSTTKSVRHFIYTWLGIEYGREGVELICVDEATLRRHPTLTAQWCLVDEVPEVPTGDDHMKV